MKMQPKTTTIALLIICASVNFIGSAGDVLSADLETALSDAHDLAELTAQNLQEDRIFANADLSALLAERQFQLDRQGKQVTSVFRCVFSRKRVFCAASVE